MKMRTLIATATTAAVLATAGVSLAGAAAHSSSTGSSSTGSSSSTPAPNATAPTSGAPAPGVAAPAIARRRLTRRQRVRLRALLRGAGGVVTNTIGIDRKTLRQDLRAGQTIAQIATAKGVYPQTVVTALVTAATNTLETAVTNGRIDAKRAHAIEQRLPKVLTRLVNSWHPRRFRSAV